MRDRSSRALVFALALAVVYFVAAKLGLSMAFVAEQVTVVWPPSGIALAAVLLLGQRVWPGIYFGAFLANVTSHESVLTAGAIAVGNTLEALSGAWLLRNVTGFDSALERLRDVLSLVLAAAVSTTVAATIGATSLCVGGAQPWTAYGSLWGVWWLGDVMGDLLLVPALLTCIAWSRVRWPSRRILEAIVLLVGLAGVSHAVFSMRYGSAASAYPLEYMVFPFMIWAALRFAEPVTALSILLMSGFAIWGTVSGLGPFSGDTVSESLKLLQIFLGVVALTALVMAAAITERNTSARRRGADYAVTQILAEASTLHEAAPRIVRAICELLDWDLGAIWTVDTGANELRCVEVWHEPSVKVEKFEKATRSRTFAPGVGLPGRVWSSGTPAWIPDVVEDANFPRSPIATQEGLHAAFGFPIVQGGRTIGVIEFFSREIRHPDNNLLQMFATIGSQIGLFIGRKAFEEAVAESEERMRAILESAYDGIVTMDHEGKVIEFNPAAESIFGYARQEAMGRQLSDLIVPFHLRERHNQGLARYLATGSGRIVGKRVEMPALREDGTEFPAEVAIVAIHRHGPPFFTAYIRDITSRLRAEEERTQLLRSEQVARAEADAANQMKDEFLATVSHELRTPLTAMLGWAHLLREGKLDDESAAHAVETIERNARVQAQIIEDILDVSRIITGKLRLDLRPVELVPVVEAALDSVSPTAEARGVRLEKAIDPQAGQVLGDPSRLQQIAWNLLSNAIKFTPRGGSVAIRLSRENGGVEIQVADTGQGINRDFLPHVFDRFRQADSSTTRSYGGLGLGLAIVRHLVELHGGTVEAHSEGEGRGATFTVHFPLAEAISTLPLPHAEPRPLPRPPVMSARLGGVANLSGVRVLVVDDEQDARELIRSVLCQCGAEVRAVGTPSEALAMIGDWNPNVLVSDIGMPGEDGYSFIRKVRSLDPEHGGNLPAAALTAYAKDEDRARALSAGYQTHVAKPIDPADLAIVVATLSGRTPSVG